LGSAPLPGLATSLIIPSYIDQEVIPCLVHLHNETTAFPLPKTIVLT